MNYQKEDKKTYIHKVDCRKGNFTTLNNENIMELPPYPSKIHEILLSKPASWKLNRKYFYKWFKEKAGVGRAVVDRAIKYLIEHGYIVQIQGRNPAGMFGSCEYHVYEIPIKSKSTAEPKKAQQKTEEKENLKNKKPIKSKAPKNQQKEKVEKIENREIEIPQNANPIIKKLLEIGKKNIERKKEEMQKLKEMKIKGKRSVCKKGKTIILTKPVKSSIYTAPRKPAERLDDNIVIKELNNKHCCCSHECEKETVDNFLKDQNIENNEGIELIQRTALETRGVKLKKQFLTELIRKYSFAVVLEKVSILMPIANTQNYQGFLRRACENNWQIEAPPQKNYYNFRKFGKKYKYANQSTDKHTDSGNFFAKVPAGLKYLDNLYMS